MPLELPLTWWHGALPSFESLSSHQFSEGTESIKVFLAPGSCELQVSHDNFFVLGYFGALYVLKKARDVTAFFFFFFYWFYASMSLANNWHNKYLLMNEWMGLSWMMSSQTSLDHVVFFWKHQMGSLWLDSWNWDKYKWATSYISWLMENIFPFSRSHLGSSVAPLGRYGKLLVSGPFCYPRVLSDTPFLSG